MLGGEVQGEASGIQIGGIELSVLHHGIRIAAQRVVRRIIAPGAAEPGFTIVRPERSTEPADSD
jgi:hypothetical protein